MLFFLTNRPLHLYIRSTSSYSHIPSYSIKRYKWKVMESIVDDSCCSMSSTDDESVAQFNCIIAKFQEKSCAPPHHTLPKLSEVQ